MLFCSFITLGKRPPEVAFRAGSSTKTGFFLLVCLVSWSHRLSDVAASTDGCKKKILSPPQAHSIYAYIAPLTILEDVNPSSASHNVVFLPSCRHSSQYFLELHT